MAHFTQLGLSGEPERKPENTAVRKTSGAGPRPESHHTKLSNKQKTAAMICSVIAMSLLGVSLLETGGCSKASNKSAGITAPSAVASNQSTPAPTVAPEPVPAAPAMAAAKKPMAKKPRQRTLVASTYTNPTYGVTFRYLKPYSLLEGDKANEEWGALEPAQMNFVQPGGTTISTVELPGRLYAGTDFASAFFNLSVNTNLTAAACEQFAAPAVSPAAPAQDGASPAAAETAKPVEPSKGKLGAAEFTEVENAGGEAAKHSDAKYYHVFQNGTCYEFALGVETKGDGATSGTKTVDRNEVFRRLNWMLSTVKIQPAGVPEPAAQASGTTVGGGKD